MESRSDDPARNDLSSEVRANADPVPFGVCEHGVGRGFVVGDYLTPGRHGRGDPLLGCLWGDPHVEVEPLTWCRVRVGRLKPHIRKPAVGIDKLAVLEVAGGSVQQRRPERPFERNVCAVETDLHLENCRWLGSQATAPGDIAYPARGHDVRVCDQPPSIVRSES